MEGGAIFLADPSLIVDPNCTLNPLALQIRKYITHPRLQMSALSVVSFSHDRTKVTVALCPWFPSVTIGLRLQLHFLQAAWEWVFPMQASA